MKIDFRVLGLFGGDNLKNEYSNGFIDQRIRLYKTVIKAISFAADNPRPRSSSKELHIGSEKTM